MQGIGLLGMQTAAVMKIMPKMVAMFMEGLLPIAEAAKEFTDKKLNGRVVNIGMDAKTYRWASNSNVYIATVGTYLVVTCSNFAWKSSVTFW